MSKEWNDDDDPEDRAVDEKDYQQHKDALIYAIEVSPSMLAPQKGDPQNRSAVKMALKSAYDTLTDRIMRSPVDIGGVFLYGTEASSDEKVPHIYEVVPLAMPSIDSLVNLRTLYENEERFNEICRPVENQVPLGTVLFTANQKFSTGAPKFWYRRLLLITDNDNPHTDPKLRRSAKSRAVDLTQLGVTILPILINSPERPFDTRKFYDELVLAPEAVRASRFGDSVGAQLQVLPMSALAIEDQIKKYRLVKRSEFHLSLELGPGIRIGVKGYAPFLKAKIQRTYRVYTKEEIPKMVHTARHAALRFSGNTVQLEDVRRTFKFGESFIPFEPDQIEKMRKIENPVIRILGFHPRGTLQDWKNMNHSRFLYPSDAQLSGSVRAFTSLFKSMIDRDVYAMSWCISRKNANPKLCAIVPSRRKRRFPEDEFTEHYYKKFPEGFYLIDTPFIDDVRSLPVVPHAVAPPDLINAAKEIMRVVKNKGGYDPSKHSHYELQMFYKTLQGIALEEKGLVSADDEGNGDNEPKIEDTLKPNYGKIGKVARHLIQKWHTVFANALESQGINKRPAYPSEIGSSKRARLGDNDIASGSGSADVITVVSEALWNSTLDKRKVAELRKFMDHFGIPIPSRSKKEDLVREVVEWYKKQQPQEEVKAE